MLFIAYVFYCLFLEYQCLPVNLGYQQFSKQSSTIVNGESYRAVDGKFSTDFISPYYGAITNTENQPWYLLLLNRAYLIRTIRILNGKNSPQRINGLIIKTKLTNQTDVDDFESFKYFSRLDKELPASLSATFQSDNLHYAKIILFYLNKTETLNIFEIEVWNLKNIVKHKTASQSTTFSYGTADLAIDGYTDWEFLNGKFCSHTQALKHSWWKVDLYNNHTVFAVKIIGRYGFGFRTRDVSVTVSQIDFDPVVESKSNCGFYEGILPLYTTINCKKWAIGRYVSIFKSSINDNYALSLCEVDVFGDNLNNNLTVQMIIYNKTDYVIKQEVETFDCSNLIKKKFQILNYKLNKIDLKLKGIGIKELCEENNFYLTSSWKNSNDCKLLSTTDGYETERDLYDSCYYECDCFNNYCSSISLIYKANVEFITREIFIFLKIN